MAEKDQTHKLKRLFQCETCKEVFTIGKKSENLKEEDVYCPNCGSYTAREVFYGAT